MNQPNIVEKAFVASGLSIREFSAKVGLSSGGICDMRANRRAIPPWVAAKCGEMIGEPWQKAVAENGEDQARSEAERNYWRDCLRRLGKSAAVLMIAILASIKPQHVHAMQPEHNITSDLYILRCFWLTGRGKGFRGFLLSAALYCWCLLVGWRWVNRRGCAPAPRLLSYPPPGRDNSETDCSGTAFRRV